MIVMKFGGSSVGNPERILKVIDIVNSKIKKKEKIAVIFSAIQGVTDKLIETAFAFLKNDESAQELFNSLVNIHISSAKKLISVNNQTRVIANIKFSLNELQDLLSGVRLVQELSLKTLDFIQSFGERLSVYIISESMKDRGIKAQFVDARKLIKTNDAFGNAVVDFAQTNSNIVEYFKMLEKIPIITGFIGSTVNNETTTLGRGGSDYTASIFGAALKTKVIEIWTDVDGVLTADPRKVPNAFTLDSLTYEEAMEMSHFGAKVIHPPTMQPAHENKIPILIKNTFNPDKYGTEISTVKHKSNLIIKGISSIDDIVLIRIQGSGLIGFSGIAGRIFECLSKRNINIILITQASSEHSICIAILPKFAETAKLALETELKYEIYEKRISKIIIERNLSIIAVVGENMRNTPGIAGMVLNTLGKRGINISAIAQGSSELNISMVISKSSEINALRAIHFSFFESEFKTVNIFLVGIGLIGSTLLEQINKQHDTLKNNSKLDIRVLGIANSQKMLFNRDGIDISKWKRLIENSELNYSTEVFLDTMKSFNLAEPIFIDATASDTIPGFYIDILNSHASIITPNKKANSSTYKKYIELKNTARDRNVKYLYKTNVGAGLPIIPTLNDIVESGDKLYKIEGIFSGTLSYIFNEFDGEKKFSEIVIEAKDLGFTEPDPRDDLKGIDVARKLLILIRESGLAFELNKIKMK